MSEPNYIDCPHCGLSGIGGDVAYFKDIRMIEWTVIHPNSKNCIKTFQAI